VPTHVIDATAIRAWFGDLTQPLGSIDMEALTEEATLGDLKGGMPSALALKLSSFRVISTCTTYLNTFHCSRSIKADKL